MYICVPPPIFEPYPYSMQPNVICNIYPVLIRLIAAQANVEVIDVFSALENRKDSLRDNCHPNEIGS